MTGDVDPLVLIVDDDARNAKLARDVLRAAGLRTLEAATGADALVRAREAQPAVILMDIRLPDMAGGDVARQLKADPRTRGIPVIALTALALADGGLPEGMFDGYLAKPIDVPSFPDEVRRLSER
jgi:two-component system cell cycle response regulator DivK